jgi:hypothetical protein
MTLLWKDKRDVCMLSSIHDEVETVGEKKCGLKCYIKVCIDCNDAVGVVTYLINICDVRYEKMVEEITDLLPLIRFDNFQLLYSMQEIWCHINIHQFYMEIIQKLFQKYRGATPPEAKLVRQ